MKHYWITSAIKDIVVKCATLALTSIGMIYIMIEGSGDYSLLFLAAVNLLMFAGFGLISLCKAYDFYNEEYVPYMLNEIEEAKNEANQREANQAMEMAQKRDTQSGNDCVRSDNICDILDSSVGTCVNSNSNGESLVLDNSDGRDTVLGRTVYPSLDNSDSNDDRAEETSSENKE